MKKFHPYRLATVLTTMMLAMGLLVSCGPSRTPLLPYEEAAARWDATVDEHITDTTRAETLKEMGRRLSELQTSLSTDIAALTEKMMELNADYDTTREEARQVVADFMQKRNTALAQYRDIVFAMRRQVSADEWKALMD